LVNAGSSCSATINSLSDVSDAVKCTTITINGFTVPARKSLILKLVTGTTITMNGDISFGNASWAGPLFIISGKSITFNGNGHKFDGGGPFYWDGQGLSGGIQKPKPMMELVMSGTFTGVKVVNSPASTYSVCNAGVLTMSNLVIDNSQGDLPNKQSKGLPAGHNTDGFDVSASNLTIENCSVHNQDDCVAINEGSNIVIRGNTCTNGHGISIGSIDSDTTVSNVLISGNTVIRNDQALRIKTKSYAHNSMVANITYAGNTATGMRRFGILIDQSYPKTLKNAGTGVVVSAVNFKPQMSSITVDSDAQDVAVNCGTGACVGTWDWTYLNVSGGVSGPMNYKISGFRQY